MKAVLGESHKVDVRRLRSRPLRQGLEAREARDRDHLLRVNLVVGHELDDRRRLVPDHSRVQAQRRGRERARRRVACAPGALGVVRQHARVLRHLERDRLRGRHVLVLGRNGHITAGHLHLGVRQLEAEAVVRVLGHGHARLEEERHLALVAVVLQLVVGSTRRFVLGEEVLSSVGGGNGRRAVRVNDIQGLAVRSEARQATDRERNKAVATGGRGFTREGLVGRERHANRVEPTLGRLELPDLVRVEDLRLGKDVERVQCRVGGARHHLLVRVLLRVGAVQNLDRNRGCRLRRRPVLEPKAEHIRVAGLDAR